MIIRPDDSVEKLVEWGVLPQWIADDALRHGMYIAEYILCEFDWEWGWDLGDGYSDEQWEILNEVRHNIKDGIKDYHSNPELMAADKENKLRLKERHKLWEELRKKYCGLYIDIDNFNWLVDYVETYQSLPVFHFICYRSLLPSRTDLQKAILLSIGATCDSPMAPDKIMQLFPDLSEKTVKGLQYHNWPLYKTYKSLVEEAVEILPEPIPEETDPYWQEVIKGQKLDLFGMTPARLRRLMIFFSLNKKTVAQNRKGSAGVYS